MKHVNFKKKDSILYVRGRTDSLRWCHRTRCKYICTRDVFVVAVISAIPNHHQVPARAVAGSERPPPFPLFSFRGRFSVYDALPRRIGSTTNSPFNIVQTSVAYTFVIPNLLVSALCLSQHTELEELAGCYQCQIVYSVLFHSFFSLHSFNQTRSHYSCIEINNLPFSFPTGTVASKCLARGCVLCLHMSERCSVRSNSY